MAEDQEQGGDLRSLMADVFGAGISTDETRAAGVGTARRSVDRNRRTGALREMRLDYTGSSPVADDDNQVESPNPRESTHTGAMAKARREAINNGYQDPFLAELRKERNVRQPVVAGALMLSDAERRFCHEYMRDYDATRAALASGFSRAQADTLLASNRIKRELMDIHDRAQHAADISHEKLVAEYAKIAYGTIESFVKFEDPSDPKTMYIDPSEATPTQWSAVRKLKIKEGKDGRETEIELYDKTKALDALARHAGMFIDRKEVTINDRRVEDMDDRELMTYFEGVIKSEGRIIEGEFVTVDDLDGDE